MRICSQCIILLVLLVLLTDAASGARSEEAARRVDPRLIRSEVYSFDEESGSQHLQAGPAQTAPRMPLGSTSASSSPGAKIGETWYDKQRNGSMRRMITWGTHGTPETLLVHVNYMHAPDETPSSPDRCYYYYSWNAASGSVGCSERVQSDTTNEKAGYTVVDVTNDNRAIVGGHWTIEAGVQPYQTKPYFDSGPGNCLWTGYAIPLDTGFHCQAEDAFGTDAGFIWPAIAYQEGTDTILHVFAQESAAGAQGLAYFRMVNPEAGGVWEVRCVDTVNVISQDIDCNNAGLVVIGWTAGLNCEGDPCNGGDTCSGHDCRGYTQWDNDLYYQASTDGGATWQNRVNVTKHEDECVEGNTDPYPYRPYTDVSVLITSDGEIHLSWAAMYWPSDANCGGDAGLYRGRLFHHSPGQCGIRTIHDANWDQTQCSPNAWCLNACKLSLSECDGRLYCLFAQYNDIPGGIDDDCAVTSNPGFPGGAANADLWLTVSEDWGMTWDKARNLTKSYTPACSLDCADETWSSMAKFGTNYSGDFSGANIVVPDDCTDPQTYYLDVMYIDDKSAGGAISTEGWCVNCDVRWMRVPCCPAVPAPDLALQPAAIEYPTWTKHGVESDVDVICENIGNTALTLSSVTLTQTYGPSGALGMSGEPFAIPSGCNNKDTMLVRINVGGTVNSPGTIVHLAGFIEFISNGIGSPDTLPIEAWVTDTLIAPIYDTIETSCTRLIVANTGNFGKQGKGTLNMDYYNAGDCDTTATVYVNDGSPIIGFVKDGNDTTVNFSIFGTSYVDSSALRPIGNHTPTVDMGDYEVFESGVIVTRDSLIAIEKSWYAPTSTLDSCGFVIECLTVYLNDPFSTPPTGVYIGEAVDFDIPADTGKRNHSDFDYPRNLIYQQGSEEDGDGCQYNDNRRGGIAFLEGYHNGIRYQTLPHGAYTADNATYVYPHEGFHEDSLYKYMENSGYGISDSDNVDLHTVMTFDTLGTLLPADTYVFYAAIITQMNGSLNDFQLQVDACREWYFNHISPKWCSCCELCGDVDHNGYLNGFDMSYLAGYLLGTGPPPPCIEEADMDNYEVVTWSDLIYLRDYFCCGGPSLICPPTYGMLTGPVDTGNHLTLVETVFPANETSMTLHFNLTTSVTLHLGVLPVSIRVGGQVPTLTNCQLTTLLDPFPFVNFCGIDTPNGKVLFSFGNSPSNGVAPLSGEMATIDVSMPASGDPRPITIAWDTFSPSHYPMLVEPDKTAWTPYLAICCDTRGDCDDSGSIDVGDLTYLVAYLFQGGPAPPCEAEGDVDGSGGIDVGDLTYLVAYLFQGGPAPPPC